MPTLVQLQRKNPNVTMQWFANGRLWPSREAERDDFQMRKQAAAARDPRAARTEGAERRGSDWRPGGTHKDPRDRFKKKNRPERGWSEKDPATQRDRDKPGFVSAAPRDPRRTSSESKRGGGGWRDKPAGPKPAGPPRGDRPWDNKSGGSNRRPWTGKPSRRSDAAPESSAARPRERKPWNDKPASAPRGDRPGRSTQGRGAPSDRPWQTKPTGPRAQRKPWSNKPPAGGKRPWSGSGSGPPRNGPRKKRDDEPPDRG